ncbi:MAG: SIS domain-containing protein [Holdemanella sp.]|nr:SIS domain-containing protein [Holdemanella sp.]
MMNKVFEIGIEIIQRIQETQSEKLEEVGKRIAHAHMNGNKFFVTGSGHSHTLAEELYGRAGVIAFTIPIMTSELMINEHPTKSSYIERLPGYAAILAELYHIQENDIVMIASNSGRNAYPIEMAIEAKKRNAFVVAITNIDHSKKTTSRHASNKKLMDIADIVIDNCGVIGDSAIKLDGMNATICPTSSMANAFIAQAINVACVEELLRNGQNPEVFVSLNCDGNEDVNDILFKKYTRLY